MKTDFSINVQVNIGVSPEVVQLVTAILQRTPPTEIASATSEQPGENAAPTQGKRGKGKTKPASDTTAEAEAAPEAKAKSATDPAESAPEAEAPADGGKELTTEDIRAAMIRTRKRIEGEDYANNTDSEGYKKYHKALTAQFKNIAALLGSDKPSTLPAEQRASFIKQCEELVLQDGEITTICPY